MIFVTIGTVENAFTRLIDKVVDLFGDSREKVFIQSGSTNLTLSSNNIYNKNYISSNMMISYIKKSKLVISALGEASLTQVVKHSKNKPIFVPRQKKFREHVDDQQLLMASFVEQNDLGRVIYDINELDNLIKIVSPNLNKSFFNTDFYRDKLINELVNLTNTQA
ncbi:glycosyltransferase [Patescibacteria group bacterium]